MPGITYPQMSAEDYQFLVMSASSGNPSIASAHFTVGPDQPGFIFDHNYRVPWQKHLCLGRHTTKLVIGGYGSGKTIAALHVLLWWALVANDFKAIYAAPSNGQARSGFDTILNVIRNSRLDPFVHDLRSPVMELIVHYTRPDGVRHRASIVFVNAEGGARLQLSREVDIVHLDEAFTLSEEGFQDSIQNLGSRARGRRRTGQPRLGVFSFTTNPFDHAAGWHFVDLQKDNPDAWIFTVATYDNGNLTDQQIADIARKVPPEKREQFLLGKRVAAYGGFFPERAVLDAAMGYPAEILEYSREDRFAGVYAYRVRSSPAKSYLTAVDLGTGRAPFRNAPVIMTIGVDAERGAASVDGFWWGSGEDMQELIDRVADEVLYYNPLQLFVDSTGAQRGTYYLIRDAMSTRGLHTPVVGIDFARVKSAMLYTLRILIERRLLFYNRAARGIRQQLLAYNYDKDKKIAQDIVMTMAMLSRPTWNLLGDVERRDANERKSSQLILPDDSVPWETILKIIESQYGGGAPSPRYGGRITRHPAGRRPPLP